jgi:hypothetical protein
MGRGYRYSRDAGRKSGIGKTSFGDRVLLGPGLSAPRLNCGGKLTATRSPD